MGRSRAVLSAVLVALVTLLNSAVSSVAAGTLSPGDVLVAAQGLPGTIHHFSSSGAYLGIFATNSLESFGCDHDRREWKRLRLRAWGGQVLALRCGAYDDYYVI